MKHLIIIALITNLVYAQSSSTLNEMCSQDGFACGACEEPLQSGLNDILNDLTDQDLSNASHWGDLKDALPEEGSNITFKQPMPKYEDVLQNITNLMRENTPGGNLNFVVIGESESLQQTSVTDGQMNPRIMLKSPNSELMVTFATDPNLPGYNSIEIMRWNGKQGRYEFQEINFGDQGEPPHIDLSGKKCAECHKSPSMRPNWDTYRAWAGVVPSRDDMLEMEFDGYDVEEDKPMQADGRAYLSFLDQVAAAKENPSDPRSQRLAMLDIPFDSEAQMADQLQAFKDANNGREPTEREKVELIKRRVETDGFYRIRHFPDYTNNEGLAVNFDSKTAEAAGPSQFAFDQMLAQNMCRVTNDLRNHPDFDQFKYGLTAMIKCGNSDSFNRTRQIMPESFLEQIKSHQANTQGQTMTEIPTDVRASLGEKSPEEIFDLLVEDTSLSHDRANSFKFDRHQNFLNSYLTGVEGVDAETAAESARYYAEEVVTPEQTYPINFHAISDPGGVSGVAEDSTEKLASLRFFLEPFDVKVEHWSLVNGRDTAYNSYSFSDQFSLFTSQPIFSEIYNEVKEELKANNGGKDVCSELVDRSIAALEPSPEEIITPEDVRPGYIDQICNSLQLPQVDQGAEELVSTANQFQLNVINSDARQMLGKCMTCHSSGPFPPKFEGLQEYIDNNESEEFVSFLNSQKGAQRYIELFMDKLGVHGPTSVGSAMPPGAWSDNAEFANRYELDPLNIQNERRQILGRYLNALSQSENGSVDLRNMCNTEQGSRGSTIEEDRGSSPPSEETPEVQDAIQN